MTDQPLEQVPDHDADAERAAIGLAFGSDEAASSLVHELTPADFYLPECSLIFQVIAELVREGARPTFIGVIGRLRTRGQLDQVGGDVGLTEIAECGIGADVADVVRRVKQGAKRRDARRRIDEAALALDEGRPVELALAPVVALDTSERSR